MGDGLTVGAAYRWVGARSVLTCRSIIGSFSQTYCFPRAIDLLDSGKIRTKGMVWVQGDWDGMGKLNTDV